MNWFKRSVKLNTLSSWFDIGAIAIAGTRLLLVTSSSVGPVLTAFCHFTCFLILFDFTQCLVGGSMAGAAVNFRFQFAADNEWLWLC